MNHHKKTIKKYHTTKLTLATLSLGVLIAPVQSAVGHITTSITPDNGQVSLKAELHPHHSDHGTWHKHYVSTRSLRAVGYGDGKETSTDASSNWDFYEGSAVLG